MRKQLLFLYGKIRRFYYHKFKPSYIEKNIIRRKGDCIRCGACCQLLFKCPFLTYEDNREMNRTATTLAVCEIHEKRPGNCRHFPIDERDLRDRDFVLLNKKCGFSFDSTQI